MPVVFVWGHGRSAVLAALGHAARRPELDAQARDAAAENGGFEVVPGSEHGVSGSWAHALHIDDVDVFAEHIRDDRAIVEWCPRELDETLAEDGRQAHYPLIRYRDLRAARTWLTRAFGFEEVTSVARADGTLESVHLRAGDVRIILAETAAPADDDALTSFLHVAVADLDAHYERAVAAGAQTVQAPASNQPAARGYTVSDLEGHLWRFDSEAS